MTDRLRIGFIPLYDAATGISPQPAKGEPADSVGAFTGPAFDSQDLAKYLSAWR